MQRHMNNLIKLLINANDLLAVWLAYGLPVNVGLAVFITAVAKEGG